MQPKTALTLPAFAIFGILQALPQPAAAQDNMYVANLKGVQEKVIALAEAIPQDRYAWRPGPGVRSVSEAFMHIAGGNYYYGGRLGVQAPADVRDWEKTVTAKADVIAKLKMSFEAILGAMAKADLSKPEAANTALGGVSHGHEHMGQMIAYARANGVVPPWSR